MQPRQTFAEDGLRELSESIRQRGILQPVLVRPAESGFELIAGERRWRAAQYAGLAHIPVVVREVSDDEMLEIALVENLQREDLNPMEEAAAYRRLMEDLGYTQEEIAVRVGKDRSTVANIIRLLSLPDSIRSEVERGTLSAGHARALLSADSESDAMLLAREAIEQKLTVRQTEKLAKRRSRPMADADQQAAERRLTESLGTRVRLISKKSGAGRVEIEYYSIDELNGLIDRLTSASVTTDSPAAQVYSASELSPDPAEG
jgi:ParB family chromosome partitioning protein